MFDISNIWSSEKKFKIVTGLSIKEANFIFNDFETQLKEDKNLKGTQNKKGRPSKLDSKEVFLLLLIFIRHYLTFELLSVIFNINVSNVKRWIDHSHGVLGNVLVKKNFSQLISLNQKKMQQSALNNSEKSILMELNNLSKGL